MNTPPATPGKKLKADTSSVKRRASNPKKSTGDQKDHAKGLQNDTRCAVFKQTYQTDDAVHDNFNVTKSDKESGHMLGLHNIPKVWSVKSLGKIFEQLFDIYHNVSHGTPEDTVKAIIEAALTQGPKLIDESFNTVHDSTPFTQYQLSQKGSSKDSLAGFIARNTVSTNTSYKRFYFAIATGNSYPENVANLSDKERAKLIMTWLSSYIIISAFGDRQEIRTEYGRLPFTRLQSLCSSQIPNVVEHFKKFFKHQISNYVLVDAEAFVAAKFLPTIRADDYDMDSVFVDNAKFLSDLKSSDVEAGELMKNLVKQVADKSEIILQNKKGKLNEFTEYKHITGRQADLLNQLNGKSAVEQFFKRRYLEDLKVINVVRTLYHAHRGRDNMPPSCTLSEFLNRMTLFVDTEYQKVPERSTANQEVYENDTVKFEVIEDIQIHTKKFDLDPLEAEKHMLGNLDKKSGVQIVAEPIDVKMQTLQEYESAQNLSDVPATHENVPQVMSTLNPSSSQLASGHASISSVTEPGETPSTSFKSLQKTAVNDFGDLIHFNLGDHQETEGTFRLDDFEMGDSYSSVLETLLD